VPEPAAVKTGKKVAVAGSGPAGLAAAQQLARAGHEVIVFEREDRIGGLLRYGIPNFKMEKPAIDRRVKQMRGEGVKFEVNANVGGNIAVADLRKDFDAILIAIGAEQPRDLAVPGRDLKGIHFAMEFLPQGQPRVRRRHCPRPDSGDRQAGRDHRWRRYRRRLPGHEPPARAAHVTQFELLPKPPDQRAAETPWPMWPMQLRVESSHEEGGMRDWSVSTIGFTGDTQGNVKKLHAVRVGPGPKFERIAGTEFELDADLVLLAMGFTGPVRPGFISELGVALDRRGNVAVDANYQSSVPGVFAAGDARRGQSLVVWAIAEGRKAARGIDVALMGTSVLAA